MAIFTGTSGADTITPATRSAGVTVAGTPTNLSGDDVLLGLAGDDLLDGGIGNDTLSGGTGGPNGDRLFGNVGDDTLYVIPSGLGTRIDGGIGTDTLVVSGSSTLSNPNGVVDFSRATIVSVEQLVVDLGLATLTTAQLNAFRTLGSAAYSEVTLRLADSARAVDLTGNLAAGLASLIIFGSASGGAASVRVDPSYLGTFGYFGASTGATRDTVTGGNGFNRLEGGAGDDVLSGGRGADGFNGGAGNDTVSYANSAGGVVVSTAATGPQDTISAGTDGLISIENLIGSAFGDILRDNADVNRLTGGGGRDQLYSVAGGRDILDGGDGDDILVIGTGGQASVSGGAGVDYMSLSRGADLRATAIGGVEVLTLSSTLPAIATSAQIAGFSRIEYTKNVVLQLGDASRAVDLNGKLVESGLPPIGIQIVGSAGNDHISVGAAYAPQVTLRGAPLVGTVDPVGTGNDVLRGGAGYDLIVGYDGNDQLFGNNGLDALLGGLGDDVLNGGAGNDRVFGGTGTDTASYTGSAAGVTVSTAVTVAQNTVGAGLDTLNSIENLAGSPFADRLTGDAGANRLTGGAGADALFGGDAADLLSGEGDNDFLDGGGGADLLYGGLGADRFFYVGPVAAGTPFDRIVDFSFAQGDQVQISNGVTGVDDAAWRVVPVGTTGYLQNLGGGVWTNVVAIDNAAGLTLGQVVLNPVV